MPSASIIAFTRQGCSLASRLAQRLSIGSCAVYAPVRFARECGVEPFESLSDWAADHFGADDALVFVGATGIAVRAIAPYANDKFTDPAVVCVDEKGSFVVPLLSGHIGGANDLAREIASVCDAQVAISTATDVNGVFAVDEWARMNGFAILERDIAKDVSAAALEGREVGFRSDGETLCDVPDCFVENAHELGIVVSLDDSIAPFERTLHLVPRCVTVGIGCRKGESPESVARALDVALSTAGVSRHAVSKLATIDVKRGEEGIERLADANGWPLVFYSASELDAVEGEFASSDFVKKTVGVDNVCERAALAEGGTILLGKTAIGGVTIALARLDAHAARPSKGKLSVVGIGPGGGRDMTLRAWDALEKASLIVGYTTYIDLVRESFPEKDFASTPMRKEVERCEFAIEEARKGRTVALVCSGDPGVYGMAGLVLELVGDRGDVDVDVVAGVSASNGGAALLGAPLMHDYCVISLSDLLTPWEEIERRLRAAAGADFAICLYNPASHKRPDHLRRACEVLLSEISADTVCGCVRNIGREGEEARVLTLGELQSYPADMFTTVFVGKRETRKIRDKMVTPRGYDTKSVRNRVAGKRILLFGGTTEGRELAEWLSSREDCEVIVSCATEYGGELVESLPNTEVLTGRLSERDMETLMRSRSFACVVDATHPYAVEVSAAIEQAAQTCEAPLYRVARASSADSAEVMSGEGSPAFGEGSCKVFDSAVSAARYLAERDGRILLTTGSKDLTAFAQALEGSLERLFVRVLPVRDSIDIAERAGISASNIVAMQGPFSFEMNCAMLTDLGIDVLVTKESGNAGGFPQKVEAARACGVELVVINRPATTAGLAVEQVKEALEAVISR